MKNKQKKNVHIQKAIEFFNGSQTDLADACDVKQQHVWNWLHSEKIPVDRAIVIEVVTKGKVTKEALNPEFFDPLPKITIERRARRNR